MLVLIPVFYTLISIYCTTSRGTQAGYTGAILGFVLSSVAHRKTYCFSILHLGHSHFPFSITVITTLA
jgi:hypothetical protein